MPEFSQVARGVAVFGAEAGAKGVNLAKGHGTNFAFKLTRDRQARFFAKKVGGIVFFLSLEFRSKAMRGDLEHFAAAFAVAASNQGRMDIDIVVLLKIFMQGH